MTWSLPAGWVQDPAPNAMRVATFHPEDPAGEITITRFPGDVGGVLANVNRWRNQLGMAPISSPAEQPAEMVQVAGQAAPLFDISEDGDSPARQRMLVLFLTRPDMSWFVKMTGPHALLETEEKAFRDFVGTIRLGSATP